MKQLKHWIGEHKKMSVICLCLLLMFIGGSAVSAASVASHRAQVAEEQAKSAESETTDAEKKTAKETKDVKLSSEQESLIADYDKDTKDFIATLSASVWSTSEGRYSLKFSDSAYVETVNGEVTTHSYAISRLDKGTDQQGLTCYSVVFLTDTGTHIVSYTMYRGDATGQTDISSSLTSASMFALKDTEYKRADAVENITVKGMNSEVVNLFGNDESALVSALSKWCAVHYPAVTEATWQKVVTTDYENGVITTDFKLNNTSSVTVSCAYVQSSGEFSFSN